jgi:hypothetical protein
MEVKGYWMGREIGGKPHWLDDLADLGILCLGIAAVLVFAIVGVMFSNWFAEALTRAGFRSAPVEWIAHIVGFSLTLGVALTIGGRITNGAFWWRT